MSWRKTWRLTIFPGDNFYFNIMEQNRQDLKRTLFNETRQYNIQYSIHIFDKIIFLK